MEADQVIEKILSDARAEGDKIAKAAAAQVAAEQAAFDEQMARFEKETQAMAQKAAEDERLQILAAARMEAAMNYLAEKSKVLGEVFSQAEKQLRELPDNEYRELMAKLMVEAVESGDEQVIPAKDDPRIDEGLVGAVNKQLEGQNKGNLTLAPERHAAGGGFILQRGKIRTNVSIPVLLGQVRKEIEIELAKTLFS